MSISPWGVRESAKKSFHLGLKKKAIGFAADFKIQLLEMTVNNARVSPK
jgi:hypothetical protein